MTDADADFESLAGRYRSGRAPAGFARRVAAQAPARRRPLHWRGALLAGTTAVVLAVAIVLTALRPPGATRPADPRWRVSATTPQPPERPPADVAAIRVSLSLRTPQRPLDTASGREDDSPAG